MERKIVVSSLVNQTVVGIVEEGHLKEYYIERANQRRTVGNIYKGLVENVLPGMSATFVDIGLEKNAFLYVEDVHSHNGKQRIQDLVRKGDHIVVQVAKEPSGTKGARVTTSLTLPGRFLVLMPGDEHIGVSRQITDSEERQRLKKIASSIRPPGMGLIVRTVAEGEAAEDLAEDCRLLLKRWKHIERKIRRAAAPSLVYQDCDLVNRMVRDFLTSDVRQIIVDTKDIYDEIKQAVNELDISTDVSIELYKGALPLFDHLGLTRELENATNRRVWLDCGGYLIVDQTEALTSIDVNTGKFVGSSDLADTVLRTNLEAAREIAHQLRLRNIGGIVIIDFIDMESDQDRAEILKALETALAGDKTKTHVFGFTHLGLVEMTRKKTKFTLTDMVETECPLCQGKGRVLSDETIAFKTAQQVCSLAAEPEVEALLVTCHPQVASFLIGNSGSNLASLENQTGKAIYVKGDTDLERDQVSVQAGTRSVIEKQARPVVKGQVIEVKVDSQHVHTPQNGIARFEGHVIDLVGAGELVGKWVEAEITKVHRTYSEGKVRRVLSS